MQVATHTSIAAKNLGSREEGVHSPSGMRKTKDSLLGLAAMNDDNEQPASMYDLADMLLDKKKQGRMMKQLSGFTRAPHDVAACNSRPRIPTHHQKERKVDCYVCV